MLTIKIKVKIKEQFNEKAFKEHSLKHYVDKSRKIYSGYAFRPGYRKAI